MIGNADDLITFALASARQNIQTVREMRRPERKNVWRAWPQMELKISL